MEAGIELQGQGNFVFGVVDFVPRVVSSRQQNVCLGGIGDARVCPAQQFHDLVRLLLLNVASAQPIEQIWIAGLKVRTAFAKAVDAFSY